MATESDKQRQLEPGEFLHQALEDAGEVIKKWWLFSSQAQEQFARAEAACIAKGRAETSLRLQRDMVRPIVEQRDEARAQLAALQAAAPRWIPTSERLPEVNVDVLFVTGDPCWLCCGHLWLDMWRDGDDRYLKSEVTHWMPLPPLPSEET